MEANELRIGNTITRKAFLPENKNYHEITVSYHDIEACARNMADFEPIPLTEEWLLKFGFEFDTITFSKGLLMFSPSSNWDKSAVWYGTLTHGRISIEMKYVHQLQNLYFALTGEELKTIE